MLEIRKIYMGENLNQKSLYSYLIVFSTVNFQIFTSKLEKIKNETLFNTNLQEIAIRITSFLH